MKNHKTFYIVIILSISLIVNFVLYISNQISYREIQDYRNDQSVLNEEISFINFLIPKLNPTITKSQLVEEMKKIKPDEKIEVLEDQICWRFYHFWFTEDGKIESVTYGS